jgi:hypothetical protein
VGRIYTASQLPGIAGEGAQADTVHARSRDGGVGDIGALYQGSFGATLAAYPEDRLRIISEGLQDGYCGIHPAARPACANQQPH